VLIDLLNDKEEVLPVIIKGITHAIRRKRAREDREDGKEDETPDITTKKPRHFLSK